MFKFLCLTVVVVLNLGAGDAIVCNGCLASTDSDCYRGVQPSFFQQKCRPVDALDAKSVKRFMPKNLNKSVPIETVCISFVVKDSEQKIAERGCGYIYEGVDICEYLNWAEDVESCSYCREDLCNSKPIAAL
ncbi:hypothetical protein FQR65_LT15678 [Abscondita terminalis]|nr:hypothetical protein FQR65_LT15678 [Abscondita terminalis]